MPRPSPSAEAPASAEREGGEPELDFGPARLETRGGLCSALTSALLLPRSTEEVVRAFAEARSRSRPIALCGARRSFEAHFVPPGDHGVTIGTGRLRGVVEIGAPAGGVLRVRAFSGTSFGELLGAVHATSREFMPLCVPTAEAISLGGALASNSHSRTSATYGGFFADRVRAFRLVSPEGRVYDCRDDAATELERALYRYVPGAFGALGLVTEIEIELGEISADCTVVVTVLESRTGDPLATVEAYAHAAAENRGGEQRWSEGVGAIFLGQPRSGRSFVLARSRRPGPTHERRALPLFGDRPARNALLQVLLHRFPAPAQWLTARLLNRGRAFESRYYRWAFFQSSWDEAVELLERQGMGSRILSRAIGVDPKLRLVHQSWVIPHESLLPFMRLYFDLLRSRAHESLAAHFELQDLVPVPESRWPLGPSFGRPGLSHVLTLNCPVHDARLLERARAFCRDVSHDAHRARLGAVVHLTKQLHVHDAPLREMYASQLAELHALKDRVDPRGLLRSRTLERLGLGP